MASGTLPTRPEADSSPTQGRYEDFIQKRLEHTRRQVRLGDVACNLMLLMAASLVFFLAVAVLDQWVFHHGLSFIARLGLFVLWVGGAGAFIWRFLVPPLARSINPVFAAQTIENGRPTLKNSLINFLLLRAHQEDVAPVVYRAMEHRAAADLLKVPVDHAVDRSRMVHLACVLAAVIGVFALYLALSPKNPLVSAGRVLWPFSSVPAPTRVHIEEVQPGSDIVFNDETKEISALVTGLRDDEEVALVVNTADNQASEDRLVMKRSDDANHFHSVLPPGSGGFQQDTFYRISAGDAATQTYKLEFHTAPTVIVDSIDYHFPPYTDKADRTIKNQGDIKALEGTQVTIHATANMEIKDPHIDLNCLGLQRLSMTATGTKVTGQFKLEWDADAGKARYNKYQILFTDSNGQRVRRPVQYNVEVDRDLPPEIEIVEPQADNVDLAEDGQLRIRVKAFDPDFALRRVALQAERPAQVGGEAEKLDLPVLLDRPKPEKALPAYTSEFTFRPSDFKLKAGDVVRYWATADDNKEPRANQSIYPRAEMPQRTITIRGAGQGGQPGAKSDAQGGEGKPQPGDPNSGQNGEGQPGEKGPGDPSNNPNGPTDGQHTQDNKSKAGGTEKPSNDPQQGDGKDPGNTDKTGGQGKEQPSTDPSKGQTGGERNSGEANDPPNEKIPADDTQRSDAVKKILEDAEKQKKDQPNQSDSSSGEKKQEPKQDPGQQGGSQQGSPQGGQKQDGQPGSQKQDGQPGGKSQDNSGQKKDQGGSSGSPQSQPGNNESGQNQPNQPQPGSQDNSTGQGGSKPPPQQDSSAGPSNSAQPQGNNDSSKPSASSQPSPQNPGGQGNEPKPSAGSPSDQKPGSQSGSDSKQKPSGGEKSQPNQSAGGGTQSEKSQSAGQAGKEPSAGGGNPQNAEKKPSAGEQGKEGPPSGGNPQKSDKQQSGGKGPGDNQLAQNSSKPEQTKPSGSQSSPSQGNPGGQKQENKPKSESSNSDGGGQGSQPKKKEKQDGGGQSGGGEKTQPGQGDKQASGGGSKPGGNQSGAEGAPQQDPGTHGNPTQKDGNAPPDSQDDPQGGGQKPGDSPQGMNQNPENPQSPGNHEKSSDTKGEAPGDRNGKGGGGAGGGQADNKTGKGADGSHKPADSGGAVSKEHGKDATGKNAGQDVASSQRTGSSQKKAGQGNGEAQKPTENQSANNNSQPSQDNSAQNSPNENNSSGGPSGSNSSQQAGTQGSGQPAGGSQPGDMGTPPAASHEPANGPDAANVEFSKKQVDLALSHLKDEKDKPNSKLLDRLGWSKEEAQKFLDNLNKLKDSAQQPGSDGEASKKAYTEFLKNLDLHPHGTTIRGQTRKDDSRDVRDSGQMEPPSDWAELYHAYSRSTAGQK